MTNSPQQRRLQSPPRSNNERAFTTGPSLLRPLVRARHHHSHHYSFHRPNHPETTDFAALSMQDRHSDRDDHASSTFTIQEAGRHRIKLLKLTPRPSGKSLACAIHIDEESSMMLTLNAPGNGVAPLSVSTESDSESEWRFQTPIRKVSPVAVAVFAVAQVRKLSFHTSTKTHDGGARQKKRKR